MLKFLNNQEGNRLLLNKLLDNQIIGVGRIGIVELNCLYFYIHQLNPPPHLLSLLKNPAGVNDTPFQEWSQTYYESLLSCDINAFWNDSGLLQQQETVFNPTINKSILIENRSVEPFYFNDPWSQALKNKRVLVVSPFENSIQSQYNNKNYLWDNSLILPDFELITYKTVQSADIHQQSNSWINNLNIMKQEISNIEFDIALLGCGAYGVPLVSHIRHNMQKTAIYIGGSLQILFGIKGKRWDSHEEISQMYNDYWIRPNELEKPINFTSIEAGGYW